MDAQHPPVDPDGYRARLHRLVGWCMDGSVVAAELELTDWSREPDCPSEARLLLAACLATNGEPESALHHLRRVEPDEALYPEALKLLIALMIQREHPEAARTTAQRLFNADGHAAHTRVWLHSITPPGTRELPRVPESAVNQLASDLIDQPQVIPSLVAALKLEPDESHLAVMRPALERMMRDLTAPREALMLCLGLAELALLAHDADDATRWAYRGLRIDPYHAPLALVVAQLEDLHGAEGSATRVLEQAVQQHPTYPDLRAAMIRRTRRDGQEEQARYQLKLWLQSEPENHVAIKLQRELAA